MSLFPSETTTMNATVYCTRGWIRQRFVTRFPQDYNSRYPYHICVHPVLRSNDHHQGRCWDLEQGGGVIPGGVISQWYLPPKNTALSVQKLGKNFFSDSSNPISVAYFGLIYVGGRGGKSQPPPPPGISGDNAYTRFCYKWFAMEMLEMGNHEYFCTKLYLLVFLIFDIWLWKLQKGLNQLLMLKVLSIRWNLIIRRVKQ